jgi:predicted PurR-regulated permease PerM
MHKQLDIHITPATIVQAVLILTGAWLLYLLRDVVMIVLTAIVIASAIEPGVAALARRKVPRLLSVIGIYLVLLGTIAGLFAYFVPALVNEIASFMTSLPEYVRTFSSAGVLDPYLQLFGVDTIPAVSPNDILAQVTSFIGGNGAFSSATSTAVGVFSGVVSFVLIIVLSFYLAVIETGVEDFLRIIVPDSHEAYVIGLWRRAQKKIGLWMQGQLLLGLIIGVLVYLGLTILDVRHALVLAVVAAMFELIPVFGPTLAAVPAVIIGFTDGGVTLGLLVIGLYVIFQQFENHLIYPLVVTKVVGVPPLLVILALIIGAKLAGFFGILLSVPAAATIQELVADMEARRRVAHKAE